MLQRHKFRVDLVFMKMVKPAFGVGNIGVRFTRTTVNSETFGYVLNDVIMGEYLTLGLIAEGWRSEGIIVASA